MTLAAGNVSIDAAGAVTKSGAAGRYFDAMTVGGPYAAVLLPDDDIAITIAKRQFVADLANKHAAWLVVELTAHAVVTVTITASDAGLQRTPSPNDPSAPTLAPTANKAITGGLS